MPKSVILGIPSFSRLQVAVEDAALVGRVDRPGQRFHQSGGLGEGQQGVLGRLGQVRAGDVFHGEIRPAFVNPDLVNLHNVRVLESGQGLGFRAKAGQCLGPGRGAGR
jgi:hypothetical protein